MGRNSLLVFVVLLGLWHPRPILAQVSNAEGNSKGETQPTSAHPLSRQDDRRSVFAGAKMERIQAFDKPPGVGSPNSDLPAKDSSGKNAMASRPDDKPPPSGNFSWQKGTQLPAKVYKNIPMNSVYLNGENIVGLRNQVLEGVNVRFDAQGNIFIDAPHYEVHHDSSYHPLLPDETPQYSKDVDSTLGTKQRTGQGTPKK